MVAAALTVGESRWEMALGIVGVVTSLFVIASPWSKFSNIRRTKEVGETKAYPYLAIIFNSAIWVIFAIPAICKLVHELVHDEHPGLTEYLGLPILVANFFGVVVELWYVYVFISCAVGQRTAPAVILGIVVVGPCVVLGLLLGLKSSRTFVGYIAMLSGAAMYAIPVYDTIVAYRANDLTEISVYQASASLANGVVWTAYSCIDHVRAFVFVPNLTAVLCAGGQLVARFFLKRKIAKEAETQRAAELAEAQRLRDLETGRAGSGSGSGHVQLTEQEEEAQRAAELAEAQRLRDLELGRAGSGSGHVQLTEQEEEAKNRAPAQDMKLGDGTSEAPAAGQQLAQEKGGSHQNTEIVAEDETGVQVLTILAPGADGGSIDNQVQTMGQGTGKTTVAPGGGASSGTVDNQVHGQDPADGDEHDGDEHDSDEPGGDDDA